MGKALIASACGLMLLVAGCGNEKADKRKVACAKVSPALQQYRKAAGAGLNFSDRAATQKVAAAANALSARVRGLEPLTSGAQRQQLEGFASALAVQEKLFSALSAHNLSAAHKFADGLDEKALDAGRASVNTICASS